MERSAMEGIAARLSAIQGLYFPGAIHRGGAPDSSSLRHSALLHLLSRDPPLFLERYGSELTAEELDAFDALGNGYEVVWHLARLRRVRETPTVQETRARLATVKNRRRAYMERLVIIVGKFLCDPSECSWAAMLATSRSQSKLYRGVSFIAKLLNIVQGKSHYVSRLLIGNHAVNCENLNSVKSQLLLFPQALPHL